MTTIFSALRALEGEQEDPDAKAARIEAQMTDDERFQLLHGIMPIAMGDTPEDEFEGIPAVAGYVKGIPRLGIPDLLETDGSLGVANPLQLRPDRTTALPAGLALASTFSPEIAYACGAMIGAEARALGFNVLLGGGVNLARDPRNGRNFEYLGEDPLLAGVIGGEAIRGTQAKGVLSTVKHFSLNAQESLRNSVDARTDEAGHRESDLLAFQIAIERGQPGSVMSAYNLINGTYASGNDQLLNKVLKGDWGYKGWVMSDWGAVHDVSYFNAGLDQQSGAQLDKQVWFDKPLKAEYAAGRVSRERVSDAVRRILRSIYAVGADGPLTTSPIDYDAHAKVTQRAASEGIVLLKNDGILPLARDAKSILLVGGHADIGVLSGGGSSQVIPPGGPAALIPVGGPGFMGLVGQQLYMPSSPMKALQAALPKDTALVYDSGYSPDMAVGRAVRAELVILFATQWQIEGSDAGMTLPYNQDALIAAVAKANPNVIVVLETGNPVRMPWLENVRAVVQAWYPGSRGGQAIADVLTGDVNPGGRLPMSWPRDETQNPRPMINGLGAPEGTPITVTYIEGSDVGYRWFAARMQKPLFPFGHGLSYTSFDYSGIKMQVGKTVTARFTVRNSGSRRGAAVPQLYLTSCAGKPLKRLAAFKKIDLKPGQSRSVIVTVDPRLLAHWDSQANGWRIDAGNYTFALGASAEDLRDQVTISLRARRLKP